MESTQLSDYWLEAGKLIGFAVEAPYEAKLRDGRSFVFSARLPQFGAAQGMLLTDDYESFASAAEALVEVDTAIPSWTRPVVPLPGRTYSMYSKIGAGRRPAPLQRGWLRPNIAFKPKLHRYAVNMAERACHVASYALQFGLT
jgi:hypothetical protein